MQYKWHRQHMYHHFCWPYSIPCVYFCMVNSLNYECNNILEGPTYYKAVDMLGLLSPALPLTTFQRDVFIWFGLCHIFHIETLLWTRWREDTNVMSFLLLSPWLSLRVENKDEPRLHDDGHITMWSRQKPLVMWCSYRAKPSAIKLYRLNPVGSIS